MAAWRRESDVQPFRHRALVVDVPTDVDHDGACLAALVEGRYVATVQSSRPTTAPRFFEVLRESAVYDCDGGGGESGEGAQHDLKGADGPNTRRRRRISAALE